MTSSLSGQDKSEEEKVEEEEKSGRGSWREVEEVLRPHQALPRMPF